MEFLLVISHANDIDLACILASAENLGEHSLDLCSNWVYPCMDYHEYAELAHQGTVIRIHRVAQNWQRS